ncbi:uncharacterized protein BKCO1_5200081 [Diplodia corticola]|uniref:Uncharacterized protein n=1 Tax=Diplodia corticola TaxID=236234 RepID=A0A1J9RRQ1_9PEZI|nr:uncharacterized protein BKCO1_5200081 [Diplodia corticola]OJD31111.1 hypothetical protein BKCO1_5200081 [Diplodia corticola]
MGNASSSTERAAAPREAHRLTKPRTYNHSPSPQLGPQAGSPQHPALSSFDADDIVWTSAGSLRSKQQARQQIRLQLFGPRDDAALDFPAAHDHDHAVLADLASDIDRLTVLSRSVSNPPDPASQPAAAAMLEHAERTVDVEAAIAILQELKKNATPDQLVALHKALLPTRDEPHAVDTTSQPPPKLVRRRSTAVPGLATRSPADVPPRRDPKPTARQEKTPLWSLDQLGPSPPDLPHDDRSDRRAQTPGDMDYATLTNTIGTLMITNGAPSPAPSIISRHLDRRTSLPELHPQEEYFGLECGRPGNSGELAHMRGPLRRSDTIGPSSGYAELDAQSTEIPRRTRRSRVPSELMLQRPSTPEAGDEHVDPHPARRLPKHSADDYIAELQASPYGQTPFSRATPSPRPPQSANEDFHDRNDTEKFRTEALRILDGSMAAEPTLSEERTSNEQSSAAAAGHGFDQSLPQIKLQRPAQALHSDSGYSSGTSLKAMQLSQSQAGDSMAHSVCSDEAIGTVPSTPEGRQNGQVLDESTEAADGRSLYTINVMLASSPQRKTEESIEQKAGTEPKPESKADMETETKSGWRKSLKRSKSWKRMSLKDLTSPSPSPTPEVPSDIVAKEQSPEPQTPQRHDSAMEQHSEKSASNAARKKLQKRKSTGTHPTVQSIKPIESGSIPSVPDDLAAGYSKRIEDSPGMDHLEHTCISQTSLVEQSAVSIRFPSPVPTEEASDTLSSLPKQNSKDKRSSKRVRSPSPLKQVFSFRRKSKNISASCEDAGLEATQPSPDSFAKAASQEPDDSRTTATVSDFGSVTHSLGGSPYDIALSSLPVKPQVSGSSAVQPHHLSTALVKPSKSGQNMDDATASEYARIRSKYRAEQKQKGQQKKRSEEEANEQEGVAPQSTKPRTRPASYHDKQHQQQKKKQQETQLSSLVSIPNFSRPQSMIPKTSSSSYNMDTSSTTELDNKPLPAEPENHTNRSAYRPYRRGLLTKSFSQSQSRLTRASTFDIREEKIPVEGEEGLNELFKAPLERRHTDKLGSTVGNSEPFSAEEKMVVVLEDDLTGADAHKADETNERRHRELPCSLRIQTHGWEQTSNFWRERREAQTQSHGQAQPMHGRSMSVQHRGMPRVQDHAGTQYLQRPAGNHLHARSQSQQAMHSYSQSSSANSSARASPSISPAWSPVPHEIPSPVKQLPCPLAAVPTSARTRKRSSIQRYYSTMNKKETDQTTAKTSVESVAEEAEAKEERPAVPPKSSIPRSARASQRAGEQPHFS